MLVAVGAGVDEGAGEAVGVTIAAGPQAMRVRSRNSAVSFFMFPPNSFPSLRGANGVSDEAISTTTRRLLRAPSAERRPRNDG